MIQSPCTLPYFAHFIVRTTLLPLQCLQPQYLKLQHLQIQYYKCLTPGCHRVDTKLNHVLRLGETSFDTLQ